MACKHRVTGGMPPHFELWTKADCSPGMSWMMIWWYKEVVHESEEYTDNMCNLIL